MTPPPLVTLADLLGAVYAYPICGLARRAPTMTVRIARAWAGPVCRVLLSADERRAADEMSQWLGVSVAEARTLARQLMHHRALRFVYWLAMQADEASLMFPEQVIEGREHLDTALAQGRGALLVSTHTCASIPAGRLLRSRGYRMLSIGRVGPMRGISRLAQRWLASRYRTIAARVARGLESIPASDPNCSLEAVRWLRSGGVVHLAADVVRSPSSTPGPFLSGQRAVGTGVLELARLCRAPVLPYVSRLTDTSVRIELGAPLPLLTDGSAEACRRVNHPILIAELERQVRKYPDQWEVWTSRHED